MHIQYVEVAEVANISLFQLIKFGLNSFKQNSWTDTFVSLTHSMAHS